MKRSLSGAGLALLMLLACAHPRSVGPADAGYILPGPQAAVVFGVPPNSKIPEHLRDVPRPIVQAAAKHAQQRNKVAGCNRFFPSGEIYIVVFASFCGDQYGKEADSRLLGAFRSNGVFVGEISWMIQEGTAELHPYFRFR